MAHGWDSYFRNLPPPSSDASTLRVPLEPEGNLPPRIDNLSGHHGFPGMVSSHEGPATNMNFGTNFYQDSGLSSPGAVYPNYYGNVPWQANHPQQAVKDYNIPNFPPDECPPPHHFATPDHSAFAAELKQEYGLLDSPFLEEFSDVSSCTEADLSDMRPSCKFMHSNHHVDVAKQHNTPLWPSMSTDNIPSPFSKTSVTPFAVQSRCLSKAETKQKLPDGLTERMVTTESGQCLSPSRTETKQRLSECEQHRLRTADNVQSLSLSKTVTKQETDCDPNRTETIETIQHLSLSKTMTKQTVSNHEQYRVEETIEYVQRLSPSKTEAKHTFSNHKKERMETTENVQHVSPSKVETKQTLSDREQNKIETTEHFQHLSLSKTATKRTHSNCEQDMTEKAKAARTLLGNYQEPNHFKCAMASYSETMQQDGIEHITACQNSDQKIGNVDNKGGGIVMETFVDSHLAVHQNSDVMENLVGHQMSSESEMEEDSNGHQKSPEDVAEEEHPTSSDLMEKEPKGKEEKPLCHQQNKSQEATVVTSNGIPDDIGNVEDKLVDTDKGNDKENKTCKEEEENVTPASTVNSCLAPTASNNKDNVSKMHDHKDILQSISEASNCQDALDELKPDRTPNSDIHSLESSNQVDESSQHNDLGHLLGGKDCNSAKDGAPTKECSVKRANPSLDLNDSTTKLKPCVEMDRTCTPEKGEISSFVAKDNSTQPNQVALDQERPLDQNQEATVQEKPAQQNQKIMVEERSIQQSHVSMNEVDAASQSQESVDRVNSIPQNQESMDKVDPTLQIQESISKVDRKSLNQESMSHVSTTPQFQEPIDKVDSTPQSQEPIDMVDPTTPNQEPVGQVATTPQSKEPMDQVEPTPESKTLMDQVEPTPESKTLMDQVEPTPESKTPMDQVDPTPESKTIMDQVEPTPESKTPMDQVEPTPESKTPMDQVEPTPESNTTMDQVEPTPESNTTMDQVEPTPESNTTMDQVEPTPESKTPMDQVDPTPESKTPMDPVEPTPQSKEPEGQVERTPQTQEHMSQVDPTAQSQKPMDQIDSRPQSQEPMYEVDPTPQSQKTMDKVDPIPENQESVGQVDPTPQNREPVDQADPVAQSQEPMDQADPIAQSQEPIGQVDSTPQSQEPMDQVDSTPQNQDSIGQVDPTLQSKEPMDLEESMQQQSEIAMELQRVGDDVLDGEPLQNADETSEPEQSELDLWYGEPLSSGDDEDDDDDSRPGQLEVSQTTTEPATPLLKTSVQMRKRLQPVVVLKLLEPRDSLKQTYQCADCELTTESMDSLIEHHHRRHFNKTFHFCQTCDTYFNGQAQKHMCFASDEDSELSYEPPARKKLKSSTRICRVCRKTFNKKCDYIKHMRTHTGKTPYRCGACGWYFAQPITLRRHKTIPGRCRGSNAKHKLNPREAYMNLSKNMAAKSKTTERKDGASNSVHIRECYVKLVDIRRSKTCCYCLRRFPTLKQRQKHEYNVHKNKSRNKTYLQNYHLHKKQKSSGKSSLAETSNNLEDETENGEDSGKFKCPFCPRIFNWSYNRARHLRDCVRDLTFGSKLKAGNKFRCPMCRATFSMSQNRKRHIDNFCLKDFVLQLAKNVRVGQSSQPLSRMAKKKVITKRQTEHKSEQPSTPLDGKPHYQCLHCPAVFAHASGKYRHMKKHEIYKLTGKLFRFRHTVYSYDYKPREGNSRYGCNLCPATFADPSGKYRHMQKHKITGKLNIKYRTSATNQSESKNEKSVNHREEETSSTDFTCRFCGKCFEDSSSLTKHERSKKHKGERPYHCLECGKRFKKPTHLSAHKKTHQRRIQCTACKKILPSIADLIEHRRSHVKKGLLQCPDCPMQFQYPVYLRRHMVSHHKSSEKLVQKEQKQVQVFPKTHSPESHYQIDHNQDKPFACGGCRKRFNTKHELYFHRGKWSGISKCAGMKGGRSDKHLKCAYCPRMFRRESHQKSHHRAHRNKKNVLKQCPKCASFYGYTKITQHVKLCSEELNIIEGLASGDLASHTCMHCGRTFDDQAMCFKHEAFCDGVYRDGQSAAKTRPRTDLSGVKQPAEGPFKCKFCTKTFVKSQNLRHHILTHTEVNPYRCKTCGSCFSRHDHMSLHESRCKGIRLRLQVCVPKISLDDVGQGWKKKLERSKMAKEEEDQRFECGVCFKVLSSESNLTRHFSMIHDSEKSFVCKRCGASFTTEKSLKRHRRMVKCQRPRGGNAAKPHHGAKLFQRLRKYSDQKKQYPCKYCPRSFNTSGQRVQHTRLHTGEKPHGCERCGERFIRKDYLMRHYLKCPVDTGDMYSVLCDRCGGVFAEGALAAHHERCKTKCPSSPKGKQKKQPTPQSPPKGFSCAYCGSRFLLFSQLQQHFLTTHRQDTSTDPPTAATAPLQQQLMNMVRIKEEPLDVEYGEGLTGDGNGLFDPDAEKPHPCPQCNMRFAHLGALKGHLRSHAKIYLFRCKTCNKGYWNKSLLRRHSSKCTRLNNKNNSVTADMDLALAPVLVFNQGSQTTGTGVLRTNFKCKDEPTSDSEQQSSALTSTATAKRKSSAAASRYQCSECDKTFTDGLLLISHLENHGREEQEKKERRCVKCGRMFTTHGALMRHMANMHGETKRYPCPDCRKLFYSQGDLDIHRTCHDPNRPFNCKFCGQRFWNTRALSNHCSESHPDSMYKCRICDKSFSLKKSLARHYKANHADDLQPDRPLIPATRENRSVTRPASSAEVSGTGRSDTDDNVDTDGGSDSGDDSDSAPYFPCHVCSKTFPTFESLEDHQRYHLGEKPHLCTECGKCFFHASQLQQHQRMHKSEFQCQTCGRGFVSLFALRKHKHSHGKSRPYRCTKCSLFFPGAVQMAEHMAAAHREENFPCDLCNRSFRSKSSRAEHRKSHKELSGKLPSPENKKPLGASTSERPSPPEYASQEKLSCGICFETFDGPDKVLEHGCKPSRDRPYSCPDCDKHFIFASHLRKHNAIHQQSQPHALECNRCRMNFSYRASFILHIKKHAEEEEAAAKGGRTSGTDEDERFYKCPLCPRQFSTPNKLVDHFSSHSENTHECKTCKLTYPSKSELEEHERRCHMTVATQFECTECGNSYMGSDAFRQHRCSHQRKTEERRPALPARESASARPQVVSGDDESDVDVTGDDSYDCSLCKKQFVSKSSLLEHHNSQHGTERPFRCQYCGKGFAVKRYLREHERRERLKMAPEEKTPVFKCSQCGHRAASAKDLTVHMRKHAEKGAGDHRCFMCYKSFKQLSLLRQHEESHVGQVVYECNDCDQAFAFPHLLEEHQRSHAGPSST